MLPIVRFLRAALVAPLVAAMALAACSPGEPVAGGGPLQARRLTEAQYRQSVADIFGPDIKIAGRFEPGVRKDGLLAVGTAAVTVSPAGFEQFDVMARTIAGQVVDEAHHAALVGCRPADAARPDAACAGSVLARYGRLLFRRPLDPPELDEAVAVADAAATRLGDFHAGLAAALAGLLVDPRFLFRIDAAEPDPRNRGKARLTGYAKAQRLSYLLWDSTPDDALLQAASSGALDTPAGLAEQAERLLASPRLEAGVRAFFADFLGFDRFASLAKDNVIYRKFSPKVAKDAEEQTLRTVADHLIRRQGDYRDLFTTRHTFMTRTLGLVYKLPVAAKEGWEPVEFPPGDPRAGLLTQLSFTALHSHPGRSSATLRGKAVRELLLCQTVPAPPNNVDFAVVQDTTNPNLRTARERLTAHRKDEVCAGCHKITDPIGLALEQFDGIGQLREQENGGAIDASGDLDGAAFRDAAGLGQALHDNPAATGCLVERLYRYAAGRDFTAAEAPFRDWLKGRFAADGHRVTDLLRRIATSQALYAVAVTELPQPTREARRP